MTKEAVLTLDKPIAEADKEKYLGATLYNKADQPNSPYVPFTVIKVEAGQQNGKLTVYMHQQYVPAKGDFSVVKGDYLEGKIKSVDELVDGLWKVVTTPGYRVPDNMFVGGLLRVAGKNYHIWKSEGGATDHTVFVVADQKPGNTDDAVTMYEDDYSVTGDRLGTWIKAKITASGQPAGGEVEITVDRNDIANARFAGGRLMLISRPARVYEIVSINGDKVKVKSDAALSTNNDLFLWAPLNNNVPTILTDPTSDANMYDFLQVSTKIADNPYASAYLEPELNALNAFDSADVTPASHVVVSNNAIAEVIDKSRGPNPRPNDYETDLFWVVYASTGYESDFYGHSNDGFVRDEGNTMGVTHGTSTASTVFLESIRDAAAYNYAMKAGPQLSEATRRARTTVHEIGHQFLGEEHTTEKTIMSADTSILTDAESIFIPRQIVKMRSQIKSPYAP